MPVSRKLQTAQAPFTILVANLRGGSDPSRGASGNPVKVRIGFTEQHFPEVNRQGHDWGPGTEDPSSSGLSTKMGHVQYATPPVPVASTVDVTVVDNDFSSPARLRLGSFELVSGEDFTPGGTTALTASALASAIDSLDGFSAPAPAGSTVTVTGPPGPGGNALLVEAIYEGSVVNFTLSPSNGSFGGAEPVIGPPVILP